jgi:hypothetical protein
VRRAFVGELLKLGIAVAPSTVANYIAGTDGRPSGQRWGTFLRNDLRRSQPWTCTPDHRMDRAADYRSIPLE